mmetsp:Transcript_9493/g.19656  ORF Transcript_9493/g.19656 Transcript_9493/m.19656 type:complete len:269 (+) Transcript_9493:247-1053(+)
MRVLRYLPSACAASTALLLSAGLVTRGACSAGASRGLQRVAMVDSPQFLSNTKCVPAEGPLHARQLTRVQPARLGHDGAPGNGHACDDGGVEVQLLGQGDVLGGAKEHDGGEAEGEGGTAHAAHQPQQLAEGGDGDGGGGGGHHKQGPEAVDEGSGHVLGAAHHLLNDLEGSGGHDGECAEQVDAQQQLHRRGGGAGHHGDDNGGDGGPEAHRPDDAEDGGDDGGDGERLGGGAEELFRLLHGRLDRGHREVHEEQERHAAKGGREGG